MFSLGAIFILLKEIIIGGDTLVSVLVCGRDLVYWCRFWMLFYLCLVLFSFSIFDISDFDDLSKYFFLLVTLLFLNMILMLFVKVFHI